MIGRSYRWLLSLVVICGLLAACGSAPSAQPTTAPAAEATAPAAEATAAPADAPTEAPAASGSEEPFTIGMVLVGPTNDGGWNQSHYDAVQYVLEKVPGTEFIYIDRVNAGDKPNVTVQQAAEELIAQGADFIITNSAEYADGTNEVAALHPEVYFLHASGDRVLKGEAPPNVSNVMGRMEYGKMIAGCAAALQSETGNLSYLGPLIDPETRRMVNSAYLGAKYCWENYEGRPAEELGLKVTWIGFWFNIPGITLDPTQVVNDFINSGSDVVISGIDTTEALVEANKSSEAGKSVFAVPYDFRDACAPAQAVCLGVPYFNWGPDYVRLVEAARSGNWEQTWLWTGPDWSDLNNADTSMIGFVKGEGLSAENAATLDTFIVGLADGSINLWQGPLLNQDGSTFVEEGQTATDEQIWFTEQLLEGIEGQSS
jgi:simple sugar transport system substrate-binding protein